MGVVASAVNWLVDNAGPVIAGAVGVVVYKVAETLVTKGKQLLYNIFCSKVEITAENNPKAIYAVKQELELLADPKNLVNMNDGPLGPSYSLKYGTYRVKTKELGHVFAEYTKEGIKLYALPEIGIWPPRYQSRQVDLKKYTTDIYKKHCAPSEMIMTFTSQKDKWSFPIIRRPTKFLETNMTSEMTKVLDDITKFKENEPAYQEKGIPYRRGYLFFGIPGSGKTTVIELAAKKHNMTLYSLNLNSGSEMTDTVLINLVTSVPPNSIIILDEIDKQLDTLNKNAHKYVSIGGLLSAIDGPQRLSNSTIVVMTSNKKDFLDAAQQAALFRAGRIDRQIEFKTKLDFDLNFYDEDNVKDDPEDKEPVAA